MVGVCVRVCVCGLCIMGALCLSYRPLLVLVMSVLLLVKVFVPTTYFYMSKLLFQRKEIV